MKLLIGYKIAIDKYRKDNNLSPTEARHVRTWDQLYGYINPEVIMVGDWDRSNDLRDLHDVAVGLGYKVISIYT